MSEAIEELFVEVIGRMDEDSLRQIRRRLESVSEEAGAEGGNAITRGMGGALAALPAMATAAAVGVGAALVAGTASIVNLAYEAEQNVIGFQRQMGLAKEEAEALGQVAENAFKRGVGGSLTEAAEAIKNVKREFSELSNNEIEELAVNSSKIADVFDQEQKDISEAIKAISRTRNTSIEEATDLLTAGLQNGLDVSGDLVDTLREYGPQFEKAGVSGKELFDILINGAKSGVLGTDKIADAFKEFTLVAADGSEKTASAFEDLGLDYNKIEKDIKSGATTYGEVFGQVTEKLKDVKDVALRTDITAALFGGAGEDLADGISQIDLTKKSLENVEGSTKKLVESSQSLGEIGTKIWREITVAVLPVGKELLKIANEAMPEIRDAIRSSIPFINTFVLGFVDGVKALKGGQSQVTGVFTAIQETARSILGAIAPYLTTVFNGIAPIIEALVPVVGAVFNIINSLWQTVLKPVLDTIYPVFKIAFESSSAQVKIFLDIITGALNAIAALIRGDTTEATEILKKVFVRAAIDLQNAAQRMAKFVIDALARLGPELKILAKNAVDGYIQGWVNRFNSVKKTAEKFVNVFLGTANAGFETRSPSKKMAELAAFVSQGFVNKIQSDEPKIKKSGQLLTKAFLDSLNDLKLEKQVGRIDLSEYVGQLEKAKTVLTNKLDTVGKSSRAYREWLSALGKVTSQLDQVKGKSSDAEKEAKKLADQLARNRERIAAIDAAEKYNLALKNSTDSQLKNALAVAKDAAEVDKYNKIKSEQKRRIDAVKAAQEKARSEAKKYAEEQKRAFEAAERMIEGLDKLNLGGLDARLSAPDAITDTTKTYKELELNIVRLRDQLKDDGVFDSWSDALNQMRKDGEITEKQLNALLDLMEQLSKQNFVGPSAARPQESAARTPDNFVGPSQGRGIVKEAEKELISAARVSKDFDKAWRELMQSIADTAVVDEAAERVAGLSDAELDAAIAAAEASKDVLTFTVATAEQQKRVGAAAEANEELAQIIGQVADAADKTKTPFKEQLKRLQELRDTHPELSERILETEKRIYKLQDAAKKEAEIKKMQENIKELSSELNKLGGYINTSVSILSRFGGEVEGAAGIIGTYFTTNIKAAQQAMAGDYAGAVLTTIEGIINIGDQIQELDPAYQEWKRNITETGELIRKNMGQRVVNGIINPFFDTLERDLNNRTELANANWMQRWWWANFGDAPKVLNTESAKLLSEISGIFNKLAGAATGAIQNELINAFNTGDWEGAAEEMSRNVQQAIAKIALDYIVQTSELAPKIAKFSEYFRKAIVGGLTDEEKKKLKVLYDDIIQEQKRIAGRYRAIAEDLPGYGREFREKQEKEMIEWQKRQRELQEKAREKEREDQRRHIRDYPRYDDEGRIESKQRSTVSSKIEGSITIDMAPIGDLNDLLTTVAPQIENGALMIQSGAQRFAQAVDKFDRRLNWSKLNTVDR